VSTAKTRPAKKKVAAKKSPTRKSKTPGKKRKDIKWDDIEREYRAGQLSNSEIARQFGCVEGAIRARAQKYNWKRDLVSAVNKRIQSDLLRDDVRETNAQNEDQIIRDAAARGVEVVRQHRDGIRMGRNLVGRLMHELDFTTSHISELQDDIYEETKDDTAQKRQSFMLRAVSLPSRSSTIRDLTLALRHVINLERQAFNLKAEDGDDGDEQAKDLRKETTTSLEARLLKLVGKRRD